MCYSFHSSYLSLNFLINKSSYFFVLFQDSEKDVGYATVLGRPHKFFFFVMRSLVKIDMPAALQHLT